MENIIKSIREEALIINNLKSFPQIVKKSIKRLIAVTDEEFIKQHKQSDIIYLLKLILTDIIKMNPSSTLLPHLIEINREELKLNNKNT